MGISISNRIWPTIGIFLFFMGIQFLVFGLLADILIKIFHKVKEEKPYEIKEIEEKK
jgi:hypothetical protein